MTFEPKGTPLQDFAAGPMIGWVIVMMLFGVGRIPGAGGLAEQATRLVPRTKGHLTAVRHPGGPLLWNPKTFELVDVLACVCPASPIRTRAARLLKDGTLTAIRRHGMRKRQEWTANPPTFAWLEPGHVS